MGVLLVSSKVVLAAFAVILTAIGVVCFLFVPSMVFNEIIAHDYLGRDENGTYNEMLLKYVDPPYSMKLDIWTYSVNNSYDVIFKGAKPFLVEKGPYTFLESQHKDVRFKARSNDTRLLYRNNRHYFFNQTMSCEDCELSDKVVVPNIIFQKLVDALKNASKPVMFIVNTVLGHYKETAYITVSVGDLLFNGYEDPLIKSLCNKKFVDSICKSFGIPDRIGLFYGQNNTNDGVYEVDTGLTDVMSLGKMYSWNGMSGNLNSTFWYGKQARMINGTDSQLFPPKELFKHDVLEIFAGQACRTVQMEFQGMTTIEDLPANRYSPAKSMSDMKLQREMGFCRPETPTFYKDVDVQLPGCLPSGFMDMGGCVPGSPRIYASNAHFFGSPAALRESVDGVGEPTEENDVTYVDIEPITGVVVHALKRTQLNVGVLRGNIGNVAKMREATIVPMIWLNESVIFDAETRAQLLQAAGVLRWANIAAVGCLIAGVALFAGFVALMVLTSRSRRSNNEYNVQTDGDGSLPTIARRADNMNTSLFDDDAPVGVVNQNFVPSTPTVERANGEGTA